MKIDVRFPRRFTLSDSPLRVSSLVARMLRVSALIIWALPSAGAVAAQDPCPSASTADAEAGWEAYQAGDMEMARARFQAALDRCDNDQYSRTGLGYVELREGDEAAADSLFRGVVRAEPNNVDALVGLGLVSWRAADLPAVRDYFEAVMELSPEHPTAMEYLARVRGRVSAGSGDEPSGVDEADAAWQAGDTDRAFGLYQLRLESSPNDDRALHRLALVHAWREEYDRSLELFDRLLTTAPRNMDARVDRARVLAWRGDTGAALSVLDAVLAEHPDHPGALEAQGLFLAWAGEYEESLMSYGRLLSLNPEDSGARIQKARVLSWASDFEGSRGVYEELLTEDPGNFEARLGLARTLAFDDDLEGSLAQYDRVLEDSPEHLGALQGKARTLAWADRLVEGEELVRHALTIDPARGDSWIVLGQILQWQGRDAAALEALGTAVELAPTNGDAHDQLRSVQLALSPLASPTVMTQWDSDGNRMLTTAASMRLHPSPRLEVRVDAYRRGLERGTLVREAFGGMVTGVWVAEPGWRFTAGVGGIVTDVAGSPSEPSLRAGVRSPEREKIRVGLDVSSQALDETAALAQQGVRFTDVTMGVRWKPRSVWRIDVTGGWARFEGSSANTRLSGSLVASRRVGRAFSFGGSVRTFGYDQNLDDGYFDPSFYGIVEAVGGWRHLPRPWTFTLEAAPGFQQVTRDGDVTPTLRGSARIGYLIGPARELSLSYGYSSAGLLSFSTGSSGYRYSALILALAWTF